MGMGRCRVPLGCGRGHLARPTGGDSSRLCSLSVGLSHVAVRYCMVDSGQVGSIWFPMVDSPHFSEVITFSAIAAPPLLESTEYNELSFHRNTKESRNGDAAHSTQTEHRAR